jgi:carbamoyl-phosphate synthase large subunit
LLFMLPKGQAGCCGKNGIDNVQIKKVHEGRPNIVDAMKNQEINLIINTPVGRSGKADDSYIRVMAIQQKVPYITTMAAAEASVKGIDAFKQEKIFPKALQDYYKEAEKKQ